MKHRVAGKRLNRNIKSRKALIRSLVISLVKNERIITTNAKAKVLKSVIDKLINKAKKQSLAVRRQIIAQIGDPITASKIFDDFAFRFTDRTSGFTRLTKLGSRTTDRAKISVIEFVSGQKQIAKEEKREVSIEKPKPTKTKASQSRKPKDVNKSKKAKND